MSKIGKQEILIPAKTEATLNNGVFTVKSEKGTLTRTFRNEIAIKIEGDKITLAPVKSDIFSNALWGTYASHIKNMLAGVNKAYEKKLIVEGIGFKADVKGTTCYFR